MKRAALALAIAAALPALAYVPPVGSIFKRAVVRSDDIDRSRDVTLRGTLQVGDAAPQAAKLQLKFPLRCRLQVEGEKSPGALSASGGPGEVQLDEEGAKMGAARDLLSLACPLLTFKGGARGEGERTLRAAVAAAGAAVTEPGLSRLGEHVVFIIGAPVQKLDVPQLWLYQAELSPARLVAKTGDSLSDLRLLEYGTPASAIAFPRVLELWQGGKLAARFEALDAGSRRASKSDEDEDRE